MTINKVDDNVQWAMNPKNPKVEGLGTEAIEGVFKTEQVEDAESMKNLWAEIGAMLDLFNSDKNNTKHHEWSKIFPELVDKIPQTLRPKEYNREEMINRLHSIQGWLQCIVWRKDTDTDKKHFQDICNEYKNVWTDELSTKINTIWDVDAYDYTLFAECTAFEYLLLQSIQKKLTPA